MRSELLHTEQFVFNKGSNGGETLRLNIKYFCDGKFPTPENVFVNQELILSSYLNSVVLNTSEFTPEKLRELANLIEQGRNKAVSKLPKWN
jgi:hypothetical protein